MAEYDELVKALAWLVTHRLQPKFEFTRGLLGNGDGVVDVPDRPGFSYVRPDRQSNKYVEMFNKLANGVDGTPILIGEIPWQPGLQQVLGIDWETYMTVGWDSRFGGIAQHGYSHEWRDGFVGDDPFTIYRRQIFPLRTEPLGSGSTSVIVNPYALNDNGVLKGWPGSPGINLSGAIPSATGTVRNVLIYWSFTGTSLYGSLGVVTGTLVPVSDAIIPPRPVEPVGTIPSGYVQLEGGQAQIKEPHIADARPIWVPNPGIDTAKVSKLVSPDGTLDVVEADNDGNVTVADGDLIFGAAAQITSPGTLQINATGGIGFDANGPGTFNALKIDANDDVIINDAQGGADFLVRGDGATSLFFVDATNELVTINESGEDVDFRVEGDTNQNLIFVDAGNDRVGIGGTPDDFFHVKVSNAGAIRVATFENTSTGQVRVQFIRSGDTGTGFNKGGVLFHTSVSFGFANYEARPIEFYTGTSAGSASVRAIIEADGDVVIGAASASGKVHVDQSSTTGAKPVLYLDQADLSEEFIEFATTVGAGNPIDTAAIGTYYGKARVSVTGVGFKYIALYNS